MQSITPVADTNSVSIPSGAASASLVLGNFQCAAVLDMGAVKVGEARRATVRIVAPEGARRTATTLTFDPNHLSPPALEIDINSGVSLAPGQCHEAHVTWRPEHPGKFRGILSLRVNGRFPARASVVGEALPLRGGTKAKRDDGRAFGKPPKKRPDGGGISVVLGRQVSSAREGPRGLACSAPASGKENRPISPTPTPSKLGKLPQPPSTSSGTLNKWQQTLEHSASGRLPVKHLPKNEEQALRDSSWDEKHAAGFEKWVNFTLIGAEELRHSAGHHDGDRVADEDRSMETPEGSRGNERGADDRSSSPLKAMLAVRDEARQRMRAKWLFRAAGMHEVCDAVEEKARDGTISLRRDRVVHADVNLSRALKDLVMSYETRWLQLGLEAVFGETIPVPMWAPSKARRVDRALRTFVSERLLKNPAIKAKHGFRGRVASGRKEMEYNNNLSAHAVTHFLHLVLFLDCAKTSKVKSSAGMLEAFMEFLHGEGSFVRTLHRRTGYVVTHKQGVIDEVDLTVSNLAVDLRDGVRLARLVEVVTGDWGLASVLRVPAVSRRRRVFNTGKVLERLEHDGAVVASTAAAPITPQDIVDGDREATLRVLWSIIARYSITSLLDREALTREAEAVVSAAEKWRRAGLFGSRPGLPPLKMPDVAALRESLGGEGSGGSDSVYGRETSNQELHSALLAWCQAVCHGYGVPVNNFTTSFADGRALCLLVHYYHPWMLPLNSIRRTTAHFLKIGGDQTEVEDSSASLEAPKVTKAQSEAALEGERANVALARQCVRKLGGIPSMLVAFDSTNIPEEKAIITVLAHLWARLLESSAEIRSAILLQHSYRSYLKRTGRGDIAERAHGAKAEGGERLAPENSIRRDVSAATATIEGGSQSTEQCVLVSKPQQDHLAAAAMVIQRWWLAAAVKKQQRVEAIRGVTDATAIVLQAAWRGRAARNAISRYRRSVEAAVLIQINWRSCMVRKQAAAMALATREAIAATTIQRWWRASEAEAAASIAIVAASTVIGAWWRSVRGVDGFRRVRIGVVALQSIYRGARARRKAAARWPTLDRQSLKHKAATMIQATARGTAVRRTAGPRIAVARFKVVQAAERARADPSQILGVKLKQAMWDLEHSKRLPVITRACNVLELTSRYCQVCCRVMAESAVPRVLYNLVRGLNRSPPHERILMYVLKILRNIALKGNGLPELIASPPAAAATLVDLLQNHRDREVFLPTVRLLRQLVVAHRATKDACNRPKHFRRLESLLKILTRNTAVKEKSGGGARTGIHVGHSARSLKHVKLLLDELSRD